MALDVPIIIEPGQTRAIYVHSAARGDRGVRYQGFWSSKSMVSSASHIFSTDSRPWYDGFRISPAHLRPWDDGFEVFSHRFASVVRDSGHNTLSIRHSTPNALHCEALNPRSFQQVGDDDCLSIHPGKGHTSAIPFDTRYGWYRGHRGLAGSLHYSLSVPPWSPSTHKHYPPKFQENIKLLLLANRLVQETRNPPP